MQAGSYLQLDDAGQFGGTGDLTVTGAASGYFFLGGANTYAYTGNVNVNSGSLRLAGSGFPLGTTTGRTLTVNSGGTLDINTSTFTLPLAVTINGLGTNGGGAALVGSAATTFPNTVTLGSDASVGGTATLTLTGPIVGGFGLSKFGANTVVMSGANTYTGTTTLSAGTLQANVADVAGTSALGNGGNITFTGGTLQLTANSVGWITPPALRTAPARSTSTRTLP